MRECVHGAYMNANDVRVCVVCMICGDTLRRSIIRENLTLQVRVR